MANLQKKVYESKKARDILDEEFVEFGPIKRSINEFFNIYDTKFYNIEIPTHKFFSEESFKYVIDYINPKEITKQELIRQLEQIQIDIDSIEKFHPIFPNNSILTAKSNNKTYYLLQSGKYRKIKDSLVPKVKEYYRHKNKPENLWTINIGTDHSLTDILNGIPKGPPIDTEKDLEISIYTINTGKTLPFNIYRPDSDNNIYSPD
jgi:hypothetical protein